MFLSAIVMMKNRRSSKLPCFALIGGQDACPQKLLFHVIGGVLFNELVPHFMPGASLTFNFCILSLLFPFQSTPGRGTKEWEPSAQPDCGISVFQSLWSNTQATSSCSVRWPTQFFSSAWIFEWVYCTSPSAQVRKWLLSRYGSIVNYLKQ